MLAALAPLLGAALLPLLAPARWRWSWAAASAVAAFSSAMVVGALASEPGAGVGKVAAWVPSLGLNLTLFTDGLSLFFALLIAGIGLLVFIYAGAYLGEEESGTRFFAYMLLFMGSMLGVVLAANLIVLFVFWEMTSVSSFLLIGFWHRHERSRQGALKALLVTATGGLAMLVGFVLVGVACSSFEIVEIIAARDELFASPWALVAAGLVMAGIVTKSAQVPFHLWLPSAMEAPTPVSAYLHAATMVKAGLYLTARLGPLFATAALWSTGLLVVGLLTMVWAGVRALRQRDLKALLALSTVSQLGLILAMLAPAHAAATAAGLLHTLNHAAFKGALFLLVGIIEHQAHSRDIERLPRLAASMPLSFTLLCLAAASMAGVPPFGGFVSKELFLSQALELGPLVTVAAVAGSALTAGYCFVLIRALWSGGRDSAGQAAPAEASAGLLWVPALLVGLAVALGPLAAPLSTGLIERSLAGLGQGATLPVELSLTHAIGHSPAALAMSAVALAGGLAVMVWWARRRPLAVPQLLSDRCYNQASEALERWSAATTRAYMSGLLWRYAAFILAVPVLGVAVTLVVAGGLVWPAAAPSAAPGPAALAAGATAVVAVLAACRARTRLAAIIALGTSGFALALMFGLLGAPDLALTQILVETVSMVLFLAAFVFLPPYQPQGTRVVRPLHLSLSLAFGFGAAALVYVARAARTTDSIADYFLRNSLTEAGGRNVVNVILVDFRGLDTLGEISVLGIAALACVGLVRLTSGRLSR